ncbi:MAG: hypothetical protein ACQEXV_17960 [Bacillota bacterium]
MLLLSLSAESHVSASPNPVLTAVAKNGVNPSSPGVETIVSARSRGHGGFQDFFALSPQNGKHLNLYVKNNGTSTVHVNVIIDGEDFGTSDVPAGKQKTRTFEQLVSSGLSGNYEVRISNSDGSLYDLQVSARQF